jgi:signal transduction histidine kinase
MNAIGLLRHAARAHPRATDVAAAAAVFAATVLSALAGPGAGRERLPGQAVAFAAIACGVLAWRRGHPFAVLLISVLAAELYMAQLRNGAATLVTLAPLIACYTVAETTGRRRALLFGGLGMLALVGAHMLVRPAVWLGTDNLALAALGGLAVAAGDAARSRRCYVAAVEERARRAEQTRESEARRRVAEERLRIARDLHDSVGHHLALINVQAGVAGFLLETEPAQARAALAHVGSACQSALEELRDTIGLLRQPGETSAPVQPVAGLSGLNELISSFRHSGLRVEQDVQGAMRRLPPAADLTAYRVIQESLTNACKHAARSAIHVRLRYEPGALRIAITHDGPPDSAPAPAAPAASASGYGILGMRERVAAVGGELRAGPLRTGGFEVSATLPAGDGPP